MAKPVNISSSLKHLNFDFNEPQRDLGPKENAGGRLAFPSDLLTNPESFYVEFNVFEYTRQRQSGREEEDSKATIRLPIPPAHQTGYGMKYNDFEGSVFYEGAINAVRSGMSALQDGADFSDIPVSQLMNLAKTAGKFALRNVATLGGVFRDQFAAETGTAINPRSEVAFGGVDLRNHNFEFTLVPTNQLEAQTIKNIIREFKIHSHPPGASGDAFLKFPREFTIGFYSSAFADQNIFPPIGDCFLQNINVTYNPHGQSKFFRDGQPTAVTLTLAFREANIITRDSLESIEEGF